MGFRYSSPSNSFQIFVKYFCCYTGSESWWSDTRVGPLSRLTLMVSWLSERQVLDECLASLSMSNEHCTAFITCRISRNSQPCLFVIVCSRQSSINGSMKYFTTTYLDILGQAWTKMWHSKKLWKAAIAVIFWAILMLPLSPWSVWHCNVHQLAS